MPLLVLHTVSVIGNKLRFYEKPRGGPIQPPHVPVNSTTGPTTTAPREHWSYDILEDEGEQKFCEIVAEIKHACAAL